MSLAVILISFACVTVVLGVRSLLVPGRRAAGWWWIHAAIGLGFFGGALSAWDHTSRWELGFDYASAAVMASAAVLMVALTIRAWRSRTGLRQRTRGVLVASVPVLAMVLVGYVVRVVPRVVDDGWWAGVPTPVLIELLPWLPERAIARSNTWATLWSLEDRAARDELRGWERARLASMLERRFRARPSAAALGEWQLVRCEFGKDEELLTVLFETMVKEFLDGSPAERQGAAGVLHNFLPTNGKISNGEIGEKEGPRVTKGRVGRLCELAVSPDFTENYTAIEMMAVTGDDGVQALPTLVRLSRQQDRYDVTESLRHLANQSPVVCDRLIAMTEGPDAYERLLAIECLEQWNWHDVRVSFQLRKLKREGDPVVAAYARRFGPDQDSRSGGDGHEHTRAVFDYLDGQSPDRAGYLASVDDFGENASEYLPRILRALSDQDAQVRIAACGALRRIMGYRDCKKQVPEVRGRLVELLKDPAPDVCAAAKAVLEDIDRT
jgi:hypothetical protein